MNKNKNVLIAGGGIAGMVAATLLAEQGFKVELYELSHELGGKAKSRRTPDGNPIEHSHRIYSKDYKTLLPILAKIPNEHGYVIDNLIPPKILQLPNDKGDILIKLPFRQQKILKNLVGRLLFQWFHHISDITQLLLVTLMFPYKMSKVGIPIKESIWCLFKHIHFLMMCEQRQQELFSGKSYGEFLDIKNKSENFQRFISTFISVIVAAKLETEAISCARLFNVSMLLMKNTIKGFEHLSTIMIMNGPTSERLFQAWAKYLNDLGVNINLGVGIKSIDTKSNFVKSFTLSDGTTATADHYICAVPLVVLADLVKQDGLIDIDPSFLNVNQPKLEWSNSAQFFLKALPTTSFQPGVLNLHINSTWDIVSIVQGEGIWQNVEMPSDMPYVLSATFSNAHANGVVFNKPLMACSNSEIFEELLTQMGFVDKNLVVGWHLDYELAIMEEDEYQQKKGFLRSHLAGDVYDGKRMLTYAPLCLMRPNQKPLKTVSKISNLYLAGEHIDTYYRIPTMEKAAESGQRCAIEIMSQVDASLAEAMKPQDNDLIKPFSFVQRLDNFLYQWQYQ
ncbi:FAD-dependent oxidoreductase [Nostoc sp. NMS4]|uniref:FAD-dependent oxidoreductase n=1 Tax=Nostoc sp. NMS4 TaxID=2815390 RepID=UPI0025F6D01F|nr:FAD-dependent oxidoreductase [Nostoc sp. NMS4]MBN3927938.1 FAD-dependent oxidoreductase [Nostoc sp. NMS4]